MERPTLADALGIPGARSVSLLDPDGPAVLWWAGDTRPDEQVTGAVVTLAAASAGLVMLTEPGDELGDVMLTSANSFHLVCLVAGEPLRVAHLTLRRAGANLAVARREFRSLVDRLAPPAAITQKATAPKPTAPAVIEQKGHPDADNEVAVLPRRSRAEPVVRELITDVVLPDWLSLLGEPYADDDGVLEKILVSLRRL